MRDNQVEKLIKEKANLVVIPDITEKIKARFKDIPPQPQKQRVFRPRRLVMVMASTFVLLAAVMTGLLYQAPETDPLMIASTDDDSLYEVVMLSSISTISLIDETMMNSQTDASMTLLAGGPSLGFDNGDDEETAITTNFNGLLRYLKLMENILSSDDTYAYQREIISRRQHKFAIKFAVSSLNSEAIDYEVVYEVVEDNDEQATLQMTMQKGTQAYTSRVIYQKETQSMTSSSTLDNGVTITIVYTKDDDQSTYQITRSMGMTIIEQVVISYEIQNEITLTFAQSEVSGTYTFRMIKGVYRNVLSIDYDILDTYYGNILVSINSANANQYSVIVRPKDGQRFIIRHAGRFN